MSGTRQSDAALMRRRGACRDDDVDEPPMSLLLRVPTFVVVTTTLGIGAHVTAGGAVPSVWRLGLILLAVAMAWQPLSRRELSLSMLLGGVSVVQVGVHLALMVQTPPPSSDLHEHAAHHMAGMAHGSPAMTVAHVVAAVLVAMWLRRWEGAVWASVRRVLPALDALFAACCVAPPAMRLPADHEPPASLSSQVLELLGDRRRGPPLPA